MDLEELNNKYNLTGPKPWLTPCGNDEDWIELVYVSWPEIYARLKRYEKALVHVLGCLENNDGNFEGVVREALEGKC